AVERWDSPEALLGRNPPGDLPASAGGNPAHRGGALRPGLERPGREPDPHRQVPGALQPPLWGGGDGRERRRAPFALARGPGRDSPDGGPTGDPRPAAAFRT